jgi:hypothetical protein
MPAIIDKEPIASIDGIVHVDDRTRETETRRIDESE